MRALQESLVTAAVVVACTLGSLFMLAQSVPPPRLTIAEVLACEDGTEVTVSGVLVDYWRYDGGSEALILADMASRATLKVVTAQGIAPQPSSFAEIGDEVQASGRVSSSRGTGFLLSSSDTVAVIRESAEAVGVRDVSKCWSLFEGDSVELRGVLIWDAIAGCPRIQEIDGPCSISLEVEDDAGLAVGREVLLGGVVRYDIETASVVISVQSITAI